MMSFENVFSVAEKKLKNNQAFVLVTIISAHKSTPRKSGAKMLVNPDGSIVGTIGGGSLEYRAIQDALKLLSAPENKLVTYNIGDDGDIAGDEVVLDAACGGKTTLFFEVFVPQEEIFIIGAGHVARNLARLADFLGFKYSVVDNREEYLKQEFFPNANKLYYVDYNELAEKVPFNKDSWIVIMTHAHSFDALCLEKALSTPAKYIGMIGSSNKVITNFKYLEKKGIKIDKRVWAPIGLKLGNSQPEQVAFSIMTQIVALKENRKEIIHFRDYFLKKNKENDFVKKMKEEGVWEW
jgi:xanthine dehydrogenase accessory factor